MDLKNYKLKEGWLGYFLSGFAGGILFALIFEHSYLPTQIYDTYIGAGLFTLIFFVIFAAGMFINGCRVKRK